MAILSDLSQYIKQLNTKQLQYYIAGYLALVLLILGLIGFVYYSRVKNYTKKLEIINQKSLEAKDLINRSKKVLGEQAAINKILDEDKTFRIVPTYQNVLSGLNLSSHSNPDLQSTVNKNISLKDKTERVLKAQLTNINTKNLLDLLSKIATIKQLYPKELVIKKAEKNRNLDIEITIATLEPEVAENEG